KGRGGAATCRRRRRRLSRAGGRVPRRRDPDRTRCRGGRLVGAAADGRRPAGAWPRARDARGDVGVKVIVTRPRNQAGPLVDRLEALGHEVIECPLIEIERTSDEPIDAVGYEWVIVTSPNGADELARRGRNLPKLAAVGPGTAERLREHGLEPAFVPEVSSQDGLLAEF